MHRNGMLALCAFGVALAGCGSLANSVTSPSATGNSPLLSLNSLTQVRYVGGDNVWLTANNSGFYELFDFNTATKTASFITPPGISGESGISYAYNPNLGGVLGFYPYQSLLHSPIVFTKDYGHSWASVNVDVKMAPIFDALALSNDQIYVAEGGGKVATGAPGATSFQTLPPLPGNVVGIYGLTDGVVAIVSSSGSTVVDRYLESSTTWTKVASFSGTAVKGSELINGSQLEVGICSQSGSKIAGEIFDGNALAPAFSSQTSGTLAGCVTDNTSNGVSLGALVRQPSGVDLVDGGGQKALNKGVTSYVATGSINLSIAPYANGIHLVDTSNNVDYADHINAAIANYVNQYQGG